MKHKISMDESTNEPSHRLAAPPPQSRLYKITKNLETPVAPNTKHQASQPNQLGNRPESTSSDSNQRSSLGLFRSHISFGYKGIKWGVSPGWHCWGYNHCILPCSQISPTHLKIRHLQIKSTGARSTNELQWLNLKMGIQDSNPHNSF